MLVALNITGGSYRHPSLPLSAQTTRNLLPQKIDANAQSPYVLTSWPGLKAFGSANGANGGMVKHQGALYKVTGDTLYRVSSSGVHTALGMVGGNGLGVFGSIADSVIFVRSGLAYQWNGSALSAITDIDLESPRGVSVINNQAVYDGAGGRFCVSDAGDATTIDGLNYATAEVVADDLTRAYTLNERLYLFGTDSIEQWWNSGTGNPPFDRVQGGVLEVGLHAFNSVASNPLSVYWLGNDKRVYRYASGLQAVSNIALSREIAGYAESSDAIGFCLSRDEQWFYVLTFPTAEKTFVYPDGGEWFELSSDAEGGAWLGQSYAYCYGKHLVADADGAIFELDDATYADNGVTVRRVRDTAPMHSGLFSKPGKHIEFNRFELIMETGVGTESGQGIDPVVMLSWSDDGGRTFSTEQQGRIGTLGEYQRKVEWFALGRAVSRVWRVAITDPVKVSILSAAADVEVGI